MKYQLTPSEQQARIKTAEERLREEADPNRYKTFTVINKDHGTNWNIGTIVVRIGDWDQETRTALFIEVGHRPGRPIQEACREELSRIKI
jgi:hypothetical protein